MEDIDLSSARDVHVHLAEVQIVDVREDYEWEAGRIETAIHIPLNSLRAGAGDDQLETERPVVVVCRSGNRSELGALMLKARGYDAHNLEGGMEDWARQDLPFTTPDGGPGRVA